MFDELPETNPIKNKKRPKAMLAALLLQVVLVSGLIILQMAMPSKLADISLLTTVHMAPLPPPPPAPPPAPEGPPPKPRQVTRSEPRQSAAVVRETPVPPRPTVEKPELVTPTEIPKDVARVLEVGPPSGGGGVIGGIPGGVPGGVAGGAGGGILGGVVGGVDNAPPPPPPKEPVRVGGNVRQPKVVHMVQPKYPPAAKSARVQGSVVIEATLTEAGTIDKVKVISGPPLLVQAAIDAFQQWKYEPTYLNGQAVPVIITAKVNFEIANGGR